MDIFKAKAIEFFKQSNYAPVDAFDIKKEVGHALIHYVIIFFIRSCRQITGQNRKMIYNEINKIVNAPILRESLKYYSPSKGNSRVLPLLMKFKLIHLMMSVCKYKSYKRYGKMKSN
ncbi:hypothetical protein HY745_13250 [Candidatus Desantisbacteria bacterium]|nr:hypothetical protein [Candidatus Desantisbacteria bacterium]